MNISHDDQRRSFQAIRPHAATQSAISAANEPTRGVALDAHSKRVEAPHASSHTLVGRRIRDVFANLA